jgi:hypothetical protein
VLLNPDEFFTFCIEQNISPSSASRAKFVFSRGAAQEGLIITPLKDLPLNATATTEAIG